ncbi:MAG: ATP-binding protein [Clostridia bacterium]|nr:ATP-binding protein [Clostridia bacterium]
MSIQLRGRIDSQNASDVEKQLFSQIGDSDEVILDAEKLEYISSAGLRVLLRIRKTHPHMRIVNVGSEVYEILDMTGFTEMIQVEKAYRVVSIEGCEEIGHGANGNLYRIDHDNVVKVYKNADSLKDIQHEREMAKLALILGIPTAISFDIVKVGDSYGSVFELLNAQSFAKILAKQPEKFDWCVKEYADMLKKIHGTEVPEGKLPDMKETALSWARFVSDYLPEEAGKKLIALIEAVPHDNHMIHGDYHTKNLELQNDEVLLIDMDTLAMGYPIFELGSMFNAYIGFSEVDEDTVLRFQGYDFETAKAFWHRTLAAYLGTTCETKIREVENKARVVGYTRLIRRGIRRGEAETERGRTEIALWTRELLELLETVDTLTFSRSELTVEADEKNLNEVQTLLEERLSEADCRPKTRNQIALVAEEVFVNIASYAYPSGTGTACVRVNTDAEPGAVSFTFIDRGVPFDPLRRSDPDLTLPAEEREIGGLGIFLTKEIMDDVRYAYRDGQNMLTLIKRF